MKLTPLFFVLLAAPAFAGPRALSLPYFKRTFAKDRVTVNYRPARFGQQLPAGSVVRTTAGSVATVNFDFKLGRVTVGPLTTLKVLGLTFSGGGAQTRLWTNRYLKIYQRPALSPSTWTSVQFSNGRVYITGTGLEINAGKDKSTVTVESGDVELSGEGEHKDDTISIPSGQGGIVETGEAPVGPFPIDYSLDLDYMVEDGLFLVVKGSTSPLNSIEVDGKSIAVDAEGNFKAKIRGGISGNALRIRVKLGDKQRTFVDSRFPR